jgi:hypothetical protein
LFVCARLIFVACSAFRAVQWLDCVSLCVVFVVFVVFVVVGAACNHDQPEQHHNGKNKTKITTPSATTIATTAPTTNHINNHIDTTTTANNNNNRTNNHNNNNIFIHNNRSNNNHDNNNNNRNDTNTTNNDDNNNYYLPPPRPQQCPAKRFYRDLRDVQLSSAARSLSFRLDKRLDQFGEDYQPANPAHRVTVGFSSAHDVAQLQERVMPLLLLLRR